MEVTPQDEIGTYVTEVDGLIYASFSKARLESHVGVGTISAFYSGKFPMFDDKNTLVKDSDKRSVTFGEVKINYFISDYSSLRHQAALSQNDDVCVIESQTSTILLSKQENKALLDALDADTEAKADELAWYAVNGEAWSKEYSSALELLNIKSEVV